MPFIGIIAKESDSNFIKNAVIKNCKKNRYEIININSINIQNIKNIRFETIVINEDIEEFIKVSSYIEEIIRNTKYIIINSDIVKNIENLINSNTQIISYGLNQKATITVSSIRSENILICIQKKIKSINGNEIEEQEINIEITKNNLKKVYNSMVVFVILTIYGEFLKKI